MLKTKLHNSLEFISACAGASMDIPIMGNLSRDKKNGHNHNGSKVQTRIYFWPRHVDKHSTNRNFTIQIPVNLSMTQQLHKCCYKKIYTKKKNTKIHSKITQKSHLNVLHIHCFYLSFDKVNTSSFTIGLKKILF